MKRFLALPLLVLAVAASGQEAPGLSAPAGGPRGAEAPAGYERPAHRSAVVSVDGFVEVVEAGHKRPRRVTTTPLPLAPGEEVRTFRSGRAELELQDGSRLSLGPASDFKIEGESEGEISLMLRLGKLWVSVAKGAHRNFSVRTTAAVASVRGTSFSVEALSRATITEVFEGAVAVEALKNGAPAGGGIVLLPGQHVEASFGSLSAVRDIARPMHPAAVPQRKSELRKDLKSMLAQPQNNNDPDKASAVKEDIKSGDVEKMRGVAQSLSAAAPLAEEQQRTLLEAFGERKALADVALAPAPAQAMTAPKPAAPDVRAQTQRAMAAWNVNREIGLQMGTQTQHTMMAKGALSPAASQASAGVTMSAYQQQYTQSYIGAQETVTQPMPAGAAPPAAAPPAATAPPPTMSVSQMPATTIMTQQPTTPPTAPINSASPPPPTPTQTQINTAPPPPGQTCSCLPTSGCTCH